eukprot:jgi/Mesvir1/25419/Mv01609-RA.1
MYTFCLSNMCGLCMEISCLATNAFVPSLYVPVWCLYCNMCWRRWPADGVTELTGSCSRTQTVLLASNSSVSFHRTPADMQISTVPTCPQWSDTGGLTWHASMVHPGVSKASGMSTFFIGIGIRIRMLFKFETPMDQSYYSFDIINATFDTVFHLASSVDGTCGAMSCVTMNDNGGASGGLSRLIMSLPKGMMYFLAVHGKQGAVGEFDLVVTGTYSCHEHASHVFMLSAGVRNMVRDSVPLWWLECPHL